MASRTYSLFSCIRANKMFYSGLAAAASVRIKDPIKYAFFLLANDDRGSYHGVFTSSSCNRQSRRCTP